jgi:hypothetical protein
VPRSNGAGGALDALTVGDVAGLVLAADLGGNLTEPLLTPREQDAAPVAGGERARERGADTRRAAGDYGDALNVRIVSRLIATVSSIGSA